MRRVALCLALAALSAIPARADGDTSQVKLPPHQSSVVVSVERGVRVWRPVTATYAVGDQENEAPEGNSAAAAYAPSYGTGGSGFGWGLPYGYGYGAGYGHNNGRKHDRAYGMNPFVAQHPALARFRHDGKVHGKVHPSLSIHVNFGRPVAKAGPRGVRGHGGGPGKLAMNGRHSSAPMGGRPAGHAGGHHGGHR